MKDFSANMLQPTSTPVMDSSSPFKFDSGIENVTTTSPKDVSDGVKKELDKNISELNQEIINLKKAMAKKDSTIIKLETVRL